MLLVPVQQTIVGHGQLAEVDDVLGDVFANEEQVPVGVHHAISPVHRHLRGDDVQGDVVGNGQEDRDNWKHKNIAIQ